MGQQARPRLTPLAIAVLALLEERPMHPYEMYQLLTVRQGDRLVKLRPGSLYHTVARLADQQLVRSEGVCRDGNRPERTTYRITELGRAGMRSRITEIIRTPGAEYPEFPVALAEAHNLPKDEVLELLGERAECLSADLAEIEMLMESASDREVPRRYWIVLPFLHAILAAEVAWVRGFLADLENGALAWDDFDSVTGGRIVKNHHAWSGADHAESTPPRTAVDTEHLR